jgi:hypothetical protein
VIELSSIAEFSRCHCIGICAVLVPTNLLITSATMLFTALDRSPAIISMSIGLSILPAITLLLHVATWWAIGVVMLPTYILPFLAITCLVINTYAMINPQRLGSLLRELFTFAIAKYHRFVTN